MTLLVGTSICSLYPSKGLETYPGTERDITRGPEVVNEVNRICFKIYYWAGSENKAVDALSSILV